MEGSNNIHKLPLPRLEFTWRKQGSRWSERVCDYFLVLPIDELDIRSNTAEKCGVYDEWRVYIGQTRVCGDEKRPIDEDGKVETPFRDYTHMMRDAKSLGSLPKYAVCEDVFTKIEDEN